MILTRRSFFSGLAATLAAPAIVHAGNLMPVKARRAVSIIIPDWEDSFLEGLSQQMASTFVYGNCDVAPTQFTGFMPLVSAPPMTVADYAAIIAAEEYA